MTTGWELTIETRGGQPWFVMRAKDAEGLLAALKDPSTADKFDQLTGRKHD